MAKPRILTTEQLREKMQAVAEHYRKQVALVEKLNTQGSGMLQAWKRMDLNDCARRLKRLEDCLATPDCKGLPRDLARKLP